MAKTAAELLSDLEQRELAPPNVLASLRRQVEGAARPVSAATIARLLVDKGHLTAVQAERLLGAPLAATRQPSTSSLAETKPMEAELGLAPLREASAPASHADKPADPTTALEPLDLGLLDLLPLDDEPAKPASPLRPAAAAQKPAAPVKKLPRPPLPVAAELTPLSPLDALDSLTPSPQPLPHPTAKPAAVKLPLADPLASALPLAAASADAAAPRPAQPTRPWFRWIAVLAIGIVVLVGIGGGSALLLWPRKVQTGAFELAEQDYRSGQFASAAEKYGAFLAADPHSEKAGLARVRGGLARILAAKGSGDDWPSVLPVASNVLAEIDHEEALPQVHAELAPLLTDMAAALAKIAEQAGDDAAERLDDARRALALADNGRYVPGTLRDWQRLALVGETLAVLERRRQAREALSQFTASAGAKLDARDMDAYLDLQQQLLAKYPELDRAPQLDAIARSAEKAVLSAVQSLKKVPQRQTSERDVAAYVALPPPPSAASAPKGTFVARASGWAWALDAASGQVLWRRRVAGAIDPILLPDDQHVLLVDPSGGELLCVERRSGALRWRVTLEDSITGPPLVAGGRVYVTTPAGDVIALDQATGEAAGGCRLPVAANSGAATDAAGKLVYQLAAADFLFVMAAGELKGQAVKFLGHARQTVHVSPLVLPGRLIVAECVGIDRTILHVLALDEFGLPTGKEDKRELPGQVLTPPLVLGDRLILLTDSGVVSQFQIPAGDAPLKSIGEMPAATAEKHFLAFGLVVGGRVCTAGAGLALLELASGESLKPRWSRFDGDWFSSPPQQVGDAIVCVRRCGGTDVAAAVKTSDGHPLWETPLTLTKEAAP